MLRLSLRSMASHRGRFLLTVLAVTLGVGFVVGAFVVTDTVRSAIDGLFDDINRGVDVTVRARTELTAGAQGGPASRGRIPGSLVEVVEGVDGVRSAGGSITGYAQLLDLDGKAVTTGGAPLLGVSWGDEEEDEERSDIVTLDAGRAPSGPTEVAIDRGTAEDYGFSVGDRTTVLLVGGQREVEIVGIFTFGETNSLLGARLTAFDLESAQEAFDAPGQLDTIEVVAERGVSATELAERIQRVLPEGVEAVDVETVNQEQSDSIEGFISVFQTVLLVFAGVALLVSAFFINNTFAILLGQRTRELGLLRAVGASRRQIIGSVLLESLLVGVLASVLGIAFGMLMALVLKGVLQAGGLVLPDESLHLAARTVVAALVVGIPVTVLSALVPGVRASSVPPIAALREGVAGDEGGGRWRPFIGGGLFGLGVVLVGLALVAGSGDALMWSSLGVGAVALFIGAAQLSSVVAGPVTSLLGRLVSWRGLPGRLARENAKRTPMRTSRAASALMIGLALVSAVFVVGTSMKESFSASIEGKVRADFIISGTGFTGFSPTVAAAVAAVDGIDAVTGVRFDQFVVEGETEAVSAVDPTSAPKLVDVEVTEGAVEDLGPGRIAIHADEATDRGVGVGDELRVQFASGGIRSLEVVAVYDDATYAGNFLVDLETFTEAYPANVLDLFVFASAEEGADLAEVRRGIEAALEPFPQLTLEDRSEFEQSQREQLDAVLVSVNGLLGLALFIALMGISNTLALSVIERTREIGLLRAVGMGRRQVRRMIRYESMVVSVFGALLGVAVGLLLGVAATLAMPESVVMMVRVPWGTLLVVVVVAALFGMLAALLPARRAARMDVLQAISAE